MNALLLVVYGNSVDELLYRDSLVNLRRLMAMGAYGWIDLPETENTSGTRLIETEAWESLVRAGKPGLWLAAMPPGETAFESGEVVISSWDGASALETSRHQFYQALEWMHSRDWGACLVEDHGLQYLGEDQSTPAYLQNLDDGLGRLFDGLGDETVVAVLLRRERALSAFVLAAPFADPSGEVPNSTVGDMAATLLHLLGLVSAEPSEGRLVLRRDRDPGQTGGSLSQDEEAILRERLSGLGYL
jgi:hypothetical protein